MDSAAARNDALEFGVVGNQGDILYNVTAEPGLRISRRTPREVVPAFIFSQDGTMRPLRSRIETATYDRSVALHGGQIGATFTEGLYDLAAWHGGGWHVAASVETETRDDGALVLPLIQLADNTIYLLFRDRASVGRPFILTGTGFRRL